jgi:hypothetical protein
VEPLIHTPYQFSGKPKRRCSLLPHTSIHIQLTPYTKHMDHLHSATTTHNRQEQKLTYWAPDRQLNGTPPEDYVTTLYFPSTPSGTLRSCTFTTKVLSTNALPTFQSSFTVLRHICHRTPQVSCYYPWHKRSSFNISNP